MAYLSHDDIQTFRQEMSNMQRDLGFMRSKLSSDYNRLQEWIKQVETTTTNNQHDVNSAVQRADRSLSFTQNIISDLKEWKDQISELNKTSKQAYNMARRAHDGFEIYKEEINSACKETKDTVTKWILESNQTLETAINGNREYIETMEEQLTAKHDFLTRLELKNKNS